MAILMKISHLSVLLILDNVFFHVTPLLNICFSVYYLYINAMSM